MIAPSGSLSRSAKTVARVATARSPAGWPAVLSELARPLPRKTTASEDSCFETRLGPREEIARRASGDGAAGKPAGEPIGSRWIEFVSESNWSRGCRIGYTECIVLKFLPVASTRRAIDQRRSVDA